MRRNLKPPRSFHRQLHRLPWLACLGIALPFAALAQTSVPIYDQIPLSADAKTAIDKGIIAAKQNDYPLAIHYFQDARKASPYVPDIYYDLGLAESKIPGRELRAIAWFGAYLAAAPTATNAAAVKAQINVLDVKSEGNLSRMIKSVQDQVMHTDISKDYLPDVAGLWAAAGDITAASRVVDQMAAFRDATYQNTYYESMAKRNIAKAQVQAGDIPGALKTADAIADATVKGQVLIDIAKVQRQARDLAGVRVTLAAALNTVDQFTDKNCCFDKAEALIAIAGIQMKMGDVTGTNETLVAALKITDLSSNQKEEIADLQIKAGDFAGAEQTANRSKDSEKLWIKVQIAKAEVEAGDIASARTSLTGTQTIVDQSNADDDSKLDRLMEIAAVQTKAKDTADAERTLARALEISDHIRDAKNRSGKQKDIAEARLEVNDVAGAQKIVGEIQDVTAKDELQSDIADAQLKAGDVVGAKKTADQIQDPHKKANAQVRVVHAQVAASDIVGARNSVAAAQIAVEQIHNADAIDDAQRYVVDAQVKAGDIAGALKAAGQIRNAATKDFADSDIVDAQAKAGDIAGAQKTAEQIETASAQIVAQIYIVDAQVKAGDIAGARDRLAVVQKIVDQLQKASDKRYRQADIAYAFVRADDISDAQMAAGKIEDANIKSKLAIYIANAQAKAGDMAGAHDSLVVAQRIVGLLQSQSYEESLGQEDIAEVQAKFGDIAGALKTADQIDEVYYSLYKSDAQATIAGVELNAGDIAGAQKIVDQIQDAGPKRKAQKDIAEAQARVGSSNNPVSTGSSIAIFQVLNQPVVPVITASKWLKILDDSNTLNAAPLLDPAGFLKAPPPFGSLYISLYNSDSPQEKVFAILFYAVQKLATAQNIVDKMLKQQAAQQVTP